MSVKKKVICFVDNIKFDVLHSAYRTTLLGVLMEVKDQIRMQMEALDISFKELATRCEVSEQTCRFWVMGRNSPKKGRIQAVEQALSFKIDFSEGRNQGPTVAENLEATDIEMFLRLRKLPPVARVLFEKVINEFVLLQQQVNVLKQVGTQTSATPPKKAPPVKTHAVAVKKPKPPIDNK